MEMFQIVYSLTSGLQTIRRNFFHRNCFTIQRPCGMVKGICIVLFPTTHREAISHFFITLLFIGSLQMLLISNSICRRQIKCRLGKKLRVMQGHVCNFWSILWLFLRLTPPGVGKKYTNTLHISLSTFFLCCLFFKQMVLIWRKELQIRPIVKYSPFVKDQERTGKNQTFTKQWASSIDTTWC